MREYALKLYSPHQVIETSKMFHRQIYHFRYHHAKTELTLQEYRNRNLLENRITLSPRLSPPFPPGRQFSRTRRARAVPLTGTQR